jgi:hypothetical protein
MPTAKALLEVDLQDGMMRQIVEIPSAERNEALSDSNTTFQFQQRCS